MKRLLIVTFYFVFAFTISGRAENWFTQESCTYSNISGGNEFFSENYKNGGATFFPDQVKRNHLTSQLQLFNDSFNTNLRVYCGRYFLSYDARWNWDTSLYSMFSPALRAAYANYTNQYGPQSTSKSVIEIFYPSYKQYIEPPGANLLVVYLECHYYLNQDTSNEVGTMEVLGLLSKGISGDDILRVTYLKSDRVTQAINALESPQDKISNYVDKIVDEFFTPVQILNPHCPECPLHPNSGDAYWDDDGRLWTWMEGADHNLKWMDLSYEFPEEGQGYDLSWKTQIPNAVQEYHHVLYLDKINFLRNDPLQRSLGGVPPALEKEIWRATQFAAVTAMKERYINQNIAIWENFIPVWGNARHAYYAFNVANGDLTYQVNGTIGVVMTALDIILCDGFIHNGAMGALRSPLNFVTKGYSFINNLGSRIIIYGRQSVVKLSLILALRNAPEASVQFFRNRTFQRAIEIFDQNAQRYIKHNPDDGKTIVAKYTEQLDGTSSLQFEREVNVPSNVNSSEQAIAENVISTVDNIEQALVSSFSTETGIAASRSIDPELLNSVRSWQGQGAYPGIDDWYIIEIPAGSKVLGGLPGPSKFFSVEKSLIDAGSNKELYWKSLQVAPDPILGYRPKVGMYTTNVPLRAAVSKTLANSQHGTGGAWQLYIEDFANKLTLNSEVPLNQ
jgi:hypothetical protein